MEKALRAELLKETESGRLYDWLANNGWMLSKDELATIAKELAYILGDEYDGMTKRQRLETLADNIADYIGEDDE